MTPANIELANVDQAKVLQALGLNVNDPKAQASLLICERYDLDPFLGHMQLVQNKPYVTRDGYLHIAHRSGRFDGMEVIDEGNDERGIWCKVAVYRKDMSRPFTAVGRVKKGEKTQVDPWDMALTRTERRALRRAFNVASAFAEASEEEYEATVGNIAAEVVQELPPASTSPQKARARAEERSIIEAAQDIKANDPISSQDLIALKGRCQMLDAGHRGLLVEAMHNIGLDIKDSCTVGQRAQLLEVLEPIEERQAVAWTERRQAVFASLPNDMSDNQRHDLIAAATADLDKEAGGPTKSTKYLTDAQTHAILDWLDQQAAS